MGFKTGLLIILSIGLLLQGCGRKSPLRLPVSHPAAASGIPATSTVK